MEELQHSSSICGVKCVYKWPGKPNKHQGNKTGPRLAVKNYRKGLRDKKVKRQVKFYVD